MALWQYDLELLPRLTTAGTEYPTLELLIATANSLFAPAPSWSAKLLIWGDERGTCVNAFFSDDLVEEICCRLDVRTRLKSEDADDILCRDVEGSVEADIGRLWELSNRLGMKLAPLDEPVEPFESATVFAERVRRCRAAQFLSDPERYLRSHGPVENGED